MAVAGLNEMIKAKHLARGLAPSGHSVNGGYHASCSVPKGGDTEPATLTHAGHSRGSQPNVG